MLTRRQLMTSSAIGLAAVPLSSCAWLQTEFPSLNSALSQASSDVMTVANALVAQLPTISSITGLSGGAKTTVTNAITAIQSLAAQVQSAASTTAAQPLIQQIEAQVNAIFATLAQFSSLIPAPFGTVLQAVAVLLPAIEAGVGMVITMLTPPATPAARKFAATAPMSVNQARLVLVAAAK